MIYRYVVLYDYKIYDVTIRDYGDLITVNLETEQYEVHYTNIENRDEELWVCVPVACAVSSSDDEEINNYMSNVESILQNSIILFEEISGGE